MKREWKKIRVLSILLLFLVTITVACSGQDNNTQNKSNENEPNVQTNNNSAAENDEPLKLSVQLEGWGTNFPKDDEVQDFIEEQTNTDLDLTWIPYGDYETRFNIQLSSKDIPDVLANVMPSGQLYSSQVVKGIEAGVFKDLTSYIDDPDFKEKYPNLGAYDDLIWESLRFNGKIYALPRYLEPLAGNSAVIIRKDLLEEAGLEDPKTMEELEKVLIKLSDEFGIYGLETTKKDLDEPAYKPLAVAYTGVQDWGVDEEGNFQFQSFMPEYNDFLLFMNRLFEAGAIDPEFSLEQDGSAFNTGNSAAKIHVWWNWKHGDGKSPFDESFSSKNPDAKAWGLLPLEGPKAHTVSIRTIQRPALINSSVADEDIPQVLELFDYTASQEYRDLTLYGLEDIHHTVEDGKKVRIDDDKFSEDAVGHWFVMFQNQMQTTEMMLEAAKEEGVSEEDINQMRAIDDLALEKAKEANLGMPHWSVSSETYNDEWGSLTRNLNENRIKVVMGQMSIEQWDEYVKGIVESDDYKQILKEFKEEYVKVD